MTTTDTATLTARVRAQLLGAGYPESVPTAGPVWTDYTTPADWSLGFMASDYGDGQVYVAWWDQVFSADRTPEQRAAHIRAVDALGEALHAAGLIVYGAPEADQPFALVVTAPAAGPEGGA